MIYLYQQYYIMDLMEMYSSIKTYEELIIKKTLNKLTQSLYSQENEVETMYECVWVSKETEQTVQ